MNDVPAPFKTPITVFVHVHYPEIWREMSVMLAERLTLPFHLILTSSHPAAEIVLPKTAARLSAQILPMENRGRDILPFLQALTVAGDFEVGLKLHTKKSPQRDDGIQWRGDVLDSLLPPHAAVEAIVGDIQADPRIGFVTPAGFCLSVRPWVLVNAPGMNSVMSTVGTTLTDSDLDDSYFAAGSMFWFRRQALIGLTDEGVIGLFEAEEGQLDGTIAHAMERLFPVQARRQGYVSLALPALTASQPDLPTVELLDLARRHADIPSRYFPAPYVAALPLPPVEIQHTPPRLRAWILPLYRVLPMGIRRILRRLRGRAPKTGE